MKNITMKRYIFKYLKLNDYKYEHRLNIKLSNYLNDVMIGLLLSDGSLEKWSDTSNSRLSVIMSMKNYLYVLHLYNLFEPYIDSGISFFNVNKYIMVRFKTISMSQLLYNHFRAQWARKWFIKMKK